MIQKRVTWALKEKDNETSNRCMSLRQEDTSGGRRGGGGREKCFTKISL